MSTYSDGVNIKPRYSNQGVTTLLNRSVAPSEKSETTESASGSAYTVSISQEARGLESDHYLQKRSIETNYSKDQQNLKARYNSDMQEIESQYAQKKQQLSSTITA